MDSSRIKSIRAGNRAAVTKFFKKLDELNTDSEMDIDIAGPIIDAIVKKQSHPKHTRHEHDPITPTYKLVFSGDILEWQYFWESFENTIHSNHTLTDVQKFTYLQSLLDADALNVINGLNLSSANYHKAVELLVNRFGKTHKIVNAYMKALLDLPAPSYTLDSIRNFSDKSEVYIRGLESLGQCQDTYGSLLIPVMLGVYYRKEALNLRSWNSNSNRLRELAETENVLDSSNEVNILGMRWNDDFYLPK
ncbi:Hypothetical predicted protein [Mytilus galloprovincialis]|uniref:Uncharacterized protein n=1 Tax=Mytilus galloprovincialis TaxID=29158 RepID=A0A8B6CMQ1_MYTGA|nr:Hypothetical predicted protein [Mytilus galloprovincialis]